MANSIEFNVDSNAATVLNQTATAADGAAKGLKTLKSQYADLKKQQDQFDPGTEKFNALSQEMGVLKDRMNDAAEAVKGNTGPAIEGMSNTFGIMGQQLGNLDFEGLTQSIGTFSANLARVNISSMTGSLKAMIAAGVQGFKTLGKTILANPIFLLIGAIVGIIAYWKELSDFVSGKSGMLENLNKQADTLKSQEQSLTRQLALQKSLGVGAGEILKMELAMLKNKQRQAEVAMEIAIIEDDKAKFLEAQQQQLTAINDLEIRKIKVYKDTQALLDKIRAGKNDEYNQQLLQNQAFSVYKNQTEEIAVQQQRNNEESRHLTNEIADAQRRGNKALEDKLNLQKLDLYNQNIGLQKDKDEIWNAGVAAKAEVKTEKELERIAASKAASAKRKSDAEAASKKLADDILAIEEHMVEVQRSLMVDKDREILLLQEKQAEELKTYEKGKKSADDLAKLKKSHETELKILTDKYAKEAKVIEDEKKLKEEEARQKEIERVEEQYQLLQKLQSTALENEINDAVLASEKLQELAVGNLDLETATQEELKAKIAEINKKYADEEQALRDKKTDDIKKKDADERKLALDTANAKLEIAQQGLTALTALGDAYFSTQLANVEKGSKAELDLKKKQFAFNKKMQIGGAIMDTAKAITAAVAANPFPSPTLPVSIALASITGAAQIAKIASTKFDGGGGGGGGGVNIPTGGDGTTAPSPANFDFLQNQPNQQPPLQAYVVGTQVSSNLEAQQLIQNQSRLGG